MQYYQRLRDVREDHDKKQSEIAAILGLYQTHYSRYERGEQELPMHHFITLARYYNVSLDYLAGLIDSPRELYPGDRSSAAGKSVSIQNRGSHNKFNIKQ